MMSRRKKIILIVISVIVIAAIIGAVFMRRRGTPEVERTVKAERITVTQDISFTGRLEAANTAELGFETGGVITSLPVDVGDKVEAGRLLMQIDPSTAQLELAKSSADLAAGQQELYLSWQKAEKDWVNGKAEQARGLTSAQQVVKNAKTEMDQQKEVYLATERESGDSSLTQSAYSLFVTKQSAYKAAQAALAEAEKTSAKINAANRGLADIAKANYDATQQAAGNAPGLSSLEASRAIAGVKLAKTTLRAPFAGIITKIDRVVGEMAPAATSVITMQTADSLEIVADVTEADAVSINPGLPASISFDALHTQEEVPGEVISIAPAGEVIEGVAVYETKIKLKSLPEGAKVGLSTNVIVHAAQKDNVIAIPRRAVIVKDDKQIIRVKGADGFIAEQMVTTGLLGSDGTIEITSGLSEGQTVIIASPAP